jgi:hypothetical protein
MSSLWSVSSGRIQLYYIVVFIFLVYSLIRYYKNVFFVFVIFVFFLGIFVYQGKSAQNAYRILMVLFALYLFFKHNLINLLLRNHFITFSFILFSLVFLITSFSHGDKFTLVFSQYSLYLLLFLFIFMLKKGLPSASFCYKINQLFFYLVLLQIILSVAKYLITGPMESIVGSMCFSGGAYATTFPVLGFVFFWMYKKGTFKRMDWIFIAGLLFMGFINYKRAIWFIMPLVIGLFLFYVQKRKISMWIKVFALIIIPVIFYLGVRLNPTLNREKKIWGSFDFNYTRNYVREYTFGSDKTSSEKDVAKGRGGVTTLLIGKLIKGGFSNEDWFGNGLTLMYVTGPKDERHIVKKYNINSIGSASGFMQSYIVFGFIGVFVTLLFVFSLLIQIDSLRLRYALIGIFCWEYFFYAGTILREPAFSFLLAFIVLFSSHQYKILSNQLKPNPQGSI